VTNEQRVRTVYPKAAIVRVGVVGGRTYHEIFSDGRAGAVPLGSAYRESWAWGEAARFVKAQGRPKS
jgi:hypothetical protein